VDIAVADPLILLFDKARDYVIPDGDLPEYTRNFYTTFIRNPGLLERFQFYNIGVNNFINGLRHAVEVPTIGHCKTILAGIYSVDLMGNILSCQNEDVNTTTEGGESHLRGTVFDWGNLTSPSVGTWQTREECKKCPVLLFCQNKCPNMPERLHPYACKQYFAHYVALLTVALHKITGALLTRIEGDFLYNQK
jgi:radical SAM protein with 4Fe4S-binding SPASM domain